MMWATKNKMMVFCFLLILKLMQNGWRIMGLYQRKIILDKYFILLQMAI